MVNSLNSSTSEVCYSWLEERLPVNVTLDDVNREFQARNGGGIAFVSLLCVVGVIGNLHVLLVFSRYYKRSSYRTYILFLGVLDLTNSAISMPLTIAYLCYTLEYFDDYFCKMYRFLLYYVSVASTFILVIIAVDRYRKIRTPFKHQWTEKETFWVCVAGLVLGLLFSWPAPVLYGGRSVHFPSISNLTGHRCYIEDGFKHKPYSAIFNIVLVSLFVLIFSSLTTLYHYIWKAVKNYANFPSALGSVSSNSVSVDLDKVNSAPDSDRGPKHSRYLQLRRTTITLLLVTMGYLVSAFPHHCLALVMFVMPDIECQMSFGVSVLYYTFVWIFFVNNVINPIIYSLSDVKFLKRVKSMYRSRAVPRIYH